jgi:hypothetical protein
VRHVSIVIVAGQSNAVGLGSPARTSTGLNLITSTATPADRAVKLAWDQPVDAIPAVEGLGAAGPVALNTPQLRAWGSKAQIGAQYFGPEIDAARALYHDGETDIVVLKVAMSGTTLASPSAPWAARKGALYKLLVKDVATLQAREAALGVSATVGAVVWYQGEFDATPENAPYYPAALKAFVLDLRSDTGASPKTPFVLVKMEMIYQLYAELLGHQISVATWDTYGYDNAVIRASDDWMAKSYPSFISTVDTIGLKRISSDHVHLTAQSELILGTAIGSQLFKMGLT